MKRITILFALVGTVGLGCFGGRPPRPTAVADGRPTYENQSLVLACPDPNLAEKLKPVAAGWATRTHARVTIVPTLDRADLVVLPPVAFGAEAATKSFLPIPDTVKESAHPYQWTNISVEKVSAWGGQVYGILLGFGSDVLIFRNDVQRAGRPLTPAATWEELLEQAESLAREDGTPTPLPPLPADDAALLHQFHLIAVGFDRESIQSQTAILPTAVVLQAATFHHDITTGAPRLRAESFVAALTLMKRLQAFRPAGTGDAVEALKTGRAKIAVLTLADLGRLAAAYQGRIPDQFSIAPVPGTRQTLDPASQKLVPAKLGINTNAYLGDSGFIGAVRKSCPHPAAAFDLLAELGGPTNSLKLVADPTLGFGPWRKEQTDPVRRDVWNGYGLNPTQMSKLITVVQIPFNAFDNPVYAPRGPDTDPLLTALAKHLRSCLTGPTTPENAMAAAEVEWKQIDAQFSKGDPLKWRRQSVGLSSAD